MREGEKDGLRREVEGKGEHTTQEGGSITKEHPRCHVPPSKRA
jgi:hypothetical protein